MTTVNLPASATLSTITLNWQGVQSLELRPNGAANANAFGPDFVIDNLVANVIPEPASWALVLLALAGAVRPAIRRRVR